MTQGLLTIKDGDSVVMKIVVGSNGYNIEKAANAIRKLQKIPSIEEAYSLALKKDFGSSDDLVVIDKDNYKFKGGNNEELSDLYRKTFNQENFNPRWELGTADYVVIISI